MHRSIGKILALYVLVFCNLKFCKILSLMMQFDNQEEYFYSLGTILGMAFFALWLLLGKNTMVTATKNSFIVLLLASIYFVIIRIVATYICTPIFGNVGSGVITLAFILAPVLLYDMKASIDKK